MAVIIPAQVSGHWGHSNWWTQVFTGICGIPQISTPDGIFCYFLQNISPHSEAFFCFLDAIENQYSSYIPGWVGGVGSGFTLTGALLQATISTMF